MRIVAIVYMYITLFTNILTLECMLCHQSLGVCEVSDPYPLSQKYGSTLYIGMDEVLANYACTFEISDLHFYFQ